MHVSSIHTSAICASPSVAAPPRRRLRLLRCMAQTRACNGDGDKNDNKTPPPSPRDKSNAVARKRFNAFLCRVDRHARPLGQSLAQFVQSTAAEDVEHLKQAIQDMCVDESGEPGSGSASASAPGSTSPGTGDGDAGPDRGWFVDIDA